MKTIKNELQDIIFGNGQKGDTSQLKRTQDFLRRNAQTGTASEKQKYLKSEEEKRLIAYAQSENLLFPYEISEDTFISEGAEQRVYRFEQLDPRLTRQRHIKKPRILSMRGFNIYSKSY